MTDRDQALAALNTLNESCSRLCSADADCEMPHDAVDTLRAYLAREAPPTPESVARQLCWLRHPKGSFAEIESACRECLALVDGGFRGPRWVLERDDEYLYEHADLAHWTKDVHAADGFDSFAEANEVRKEFGYGDEVLVVVDFDYKPAPSPGLGTPDAWLVVEFGKYVSAVQLATPEEMPPLEGEELVPLFRAAAPRSTPPQPVQPTREVTEGMVTAACAEMTAHGAGFRDRTTRDPLNTPTPTVMERILRAALASVPSAPRSTPEGR